MDLTCPKCQGAMRRYERSGVGVDQCTECRGIFLDRGELEKLVDAESSFYGGGQAPGGGAHRATPAGYPPQPPARPQQRGWGSPGSPDSPGYHRGYGDQRRHRRGGFLGGLFD
jgi:uncharacterized protein